MNKLFLLIFFLPAFASAQSLTTEAEYNYVKDSCKGPLDGYSFGEEHNYTVELGGPVIVVTFKDLNRTSDGSTCATIMIYHPPNPGKLIPQPTYFCIPTAGSPMWTEFNKDLQTFGEQYWGAMIGIANAMARYIADGKMPQKK